MSDTVGSLAREFDRLVRWGYPGLLFLSLLHLGKSDLLHDRMLVGEERLFSFIVIILVSSFVIYGLHRYVLHEALMEVLRALGWQPLFIDGELRGDRPPVAPLRWIAPYYDGRSTRWTRRRNGSAEGEFSRALYIAWAVAHGMLITAWLSVLMIGLADSDSSLRQINAMNSLRIVAGLLGVAALHQVLLLSRVENLFATQR